MTIRIARIVGSCYDCDSAQKVENAVVITNGISERFIEVPDAVIMAILQLSAEEQQRIAQVGAPAPRPAESSPAPVPQPRNGGRVPIPVTQRPRRQPVPEPPSRAAEQFAQALDSDEIGPGEVYDDPDSGVESL